MISIKILQNVKKCSLRPTKLMEDCLIGIINGRVTNIPVYDFKLNSRVVNKYITVYPNQVDVVLFEGILTFYNPKVMMLPVLKSKP